jgi:hypothetical protein
MEASQNIGGRIIFSAIPAMRTSGIAGAYT